ncbi:hypothetical protein [Glutamicibacter sp. NPDC087344]|uniref:hypothetical protein n=1 Tax=Glutamicibacter sp. NPDC087344 TaxID=3363994 RepID=UPI0037F9FFEA
MLVVYAVDSDGMPRHADRAAAFKEATCEQAAFWAANGLDPSAGELVEVGKRVASSKSIKGATVSYDAADAASAKQARVNALRVLCTSAFQILRNAGLISAVVNR